MGNRRGEGSSSWSSAIQPTASSGQGGDTQEQHRQGKEAPALSPYKVQSNQLHTVSVPASASPCKLQSTGKNV